MSNTSLGIDVSKLELSIALLTDKQSIKIKFKNTDGGFKELDKWLQKNKATDAKICMEATGHYCFGIAEFLYQKQYKVYVVNPFCIKGFANSQLSRNKTDEADAVIIAKYIRQNDANPYKPVPKIIRKMQNLYKHLQTLKDHRAQFKTMRTELSHMPEEVNTSSDSTVEHFDEQIKKIESTLLALINSNSQLKQHYENLQTIPGIKTTTAFAILSLIPEISNFSNARQLAAFAGLTPKQRASGTSVKRKTTISKMGSARLRKAVFFPAMVAKTHNPIVKKFCDNLKKKSKEKMVIIGAAMRKLIHIIFAILKHNVPFNPNLQPVT